MEVWLHAFSFPRRMAELGRQAEQWGFTGLLVADSQCLNADVWVELALAGAATTRLKLGPGVTNPLSRHLSVTASAAATLQAETGGRVVLGIGRGDSAVSQIGRRAVSPGELEEALQAMQAYLRGEEAELDGTLSAIRWLPEPGLPKVPVFVAATGPQTIAAAARQAEGVDLTLGAELERLRWGIGVARDAAPASDDVNLGAYVNVAVSDDKASACEMVCGNCAIFAGFAAGAGAQRIGREFIDRFAVAGPAGYVRDRLAEIAAEGITRLIVVPCSLDVAAAQVAESNRLFARDVLPHLLTD